MDCTELADEFRVGLGVLVPLQLADPAWGSSELSGILGSFSLFRGPHTQNIHQVIVTQILGFLSQSFVPSDRIAKIFLILVALLAQLLRVLFQLLYKVRGRLVHT